ncbi:MAG: SDR family oxidoreductase [Alphaproteobacteria bacterium]|nr:SDR family oxidoreductase [Alphaproteobacteria bacterium]
MELAGKGAVITGGTRGIGKACAIGLARAGAHVVVSGRSDADGAAVVREIEAGGGRATFAHQDVRRAEDWDRLMETTLRTAGRVDAFVANAGISFAKTAAEMSLAEFRDMIAVNLEAVFIGLQRATTAIRAHGEGGSIILMSSIVGKIGAPGYMHYGAAKAGVRLMAKAAALELGPEKIRVNSVHPGFVRTDMTAEFPEDFMASLTPLGRIGEAREIADAVVFLASDRSKFMTGAEVVLDGGLIVR